ncbi:DNA-directed RNA polymerase subunit alpha C-terminal domain-containing protein [Butyrivibrio sp. AE3004]|uniref:DNA-directed RNA polymerase subunit alpha C-terminal domain-containing protein n=1 Tax=Butyrivibrio sp. AE3004 TaxID=1506994 RepID=UPI0018CC6AA6|nr:DNA-directed RNA polymerase subunit alpha C-terminal domain-containing protein [Butyrivibrio sp. AE3004]
MAGYRVHEKKGGKFYFNLYLSNSMSEAPIEALELGVRSYNSLKRAGYTNIGELAEAIADGIDLNKIRNCGAKSSREIMEKLFIYQFNVLPQGRREQYVKDVMLLNARKHEYGEV